MSTAGASSLRQATIPAPAARSLPSAKLSARQAISAPPPMEWTVLPAMVFVFDRHPEIKAELQKQLIEHILLRASGLQSARLILAGVFEVYHVRLPCADVGGGKLEDAEAEVT